MWLRRWWPSENPECKTSLKTHGCYTLWAHFTGNIRMGAELRFLEQLRNFHSPRLKLIRCLFGSGTTRGLMQREILWYGELGSSLLVEGGQNKPQVTYKRPSISQRITDKCANVTIWKAGRQHFLPFWISLGHAPEIMDLHVFLQTAQSKEPDDKPT